jgi:hypothetical protein
MLGQHGVQPGQPLHALWDPPAGQQLPLLVQDGHVVVVFGPIDPDLDHTASFADRSATTPKP